MEIHMVSMQLIGVKIASLEINNLWLYSFKILGDTGLKIKLVI